MCLAGWRFHQYLSIYCFGFLYFLSFLAGKFCFRWRVIYTICAYCNWANSLFHFDSCLVVRGTEQEGHMYRTIATTTTGFAYRMHWGLFFFASSFVISAVPFLCPFNYFFQDWDILMMTTFFLFCSSALSLLGCITLITSAGTECKK